MLGFAVNTGRALLIRLGESDNEVLFGILNSWIYFQVSLIWIIKATEKPHTETGKAVTSRLWNGAQLNFKGTQCDRNAAQRQW